MEYTRQKSLMCAQLLVTTTTTTTTQLGMVKPSASFSYREDESYEVFLGWSASL